MWVRDDVTRRSASRILETRKGFRFQHLKQGRVSRYYSVVERCKTNSTAFPQLLAAALGMFKIIYSVEFLLEDIAIKK
jgi:hypothetical protein